VGREGWVGDRCSTQDHCLPTPQRRQHPPTHTTKTEKGKPFFHVPPHVDTPFPNWNYNVSHHGDFVGIASEPVCLVGLDIMNAKERPRRNSANDFFRSFHRQLSGAEWGAIYQVGGWVERERPDWLT
jgi:hypothetical protein